MPEIKIKYYSYYELPHSYQPNRKQYHLTVGVKDIPKNLEEWRSINPRDPKTTSPVFKAILDSLENKPQLFFDKNRGLSILADKVSIDEATSTATLHLGDKSTNGLFDGGHTHSAIMQYLQTLGDEGSKAEVKVEVLVGVPESQIVNLVTARNSFVAVKSESLANLTGSFEGIKQVLEGQSYADLIAYQENELDSGGGSKPIPVREVLGYLTVFNKIKYPGTQSVTFAYGSRERVIQEFVKFVQEIEGDEQAKKQFESLLKLLPEIIELRDKIYKELPSIWDTLPKGYGMSTTKTKYAKERFAKLVEKSPLFADFGSQLDTPLYFVPDSFLYPLLAGFRANLKFNKQKNCFEWIQDLDSLWEEEKTQLIESLKSKFFSFNQNPSQLIKHWDSFSQHFEYKFAHIEYELAMKEIKLKMEKINMQKERIIENHS